MTRRGAEVDDGAHLEVRSDAKPAEFCYVSVAQPIRMRDVSMAINKNENKREEFVRV